MKRANNVVRATDAHGVRGHRVDNVAEGISSVTAEPVFESVVANDLNVL